MRAELFGAGRIARESQRKANRMRQHTAHRLLYYLKDRTSNQYPEWREAIIGLFYELYQTMRNNPAIYVVVHVDDGITVYYNKKKVVFLRFSSKRYCLAHANQCCQACPIVLR